MILHHYNLSPFSEKIRLMFGICDLSWQSAISPAMPPRKLVDPLAGGYRRIPVAQIGADIFCDTRVISAELAQLSGRPELDKEQCSEEIKNFVSYVDSTVFMAAVRGGSPLKSIGLLLRFFTPWQAYRFIKDRAHVSRTSSLPPMSQREALKILRDHKYNMEQMLSDSLCLFGDDPCVADFSAYHLLWFAYKTRGENYLNEFANIKAWFDRMTDIGHGTRSEISTQEVFAEARDNSPRAISADMQLDDLFGKAVTISPGDYAKDAVTGKLVGSNAFRWILSRETERFGTLHVHFPKEGFDIAEL